MKTSSKELVRDLVILGPALILTAAFIDPWWKFTITWIAILFAYHYTATRHFKKGLEQGYAHSRQIIEETTFKVSTGDNTHKHVIGARYDCGVFGCPYREAL